MINKIKKVHFNESHIIWGIVSLIILSIISYIYFVNVAILHAAERQNIDEEMTNLRTSISQLELELIENTRDITKEYAFSLGFTEVSEKVFLERDPSTKLSLLNEIQSQ